MEGNLEEQVLWEKGTVSGTRLATLTPDHLEITISVSGVCIERRVFTAAAAAAYALYKMRAYNPK